MIGADRLLKIARLTVLAAYGLGIAIIMIRAGEPDDLWWWLQLTPFAAWVVAPVALPLLLVRLKSWLLVVGTAALAAHGLHVYVTDMFDPGARSTSALIFIFLPLYQWIGAAILIVLASVTTRKAAS